MVPENIHTHPMEGQWKLLGEGGGVSTAKTFKGKYEAKLQIPGRRKGRRVQSRKPSMVEVWIFFGTTPYTCTHGIKHILLVIYYHPGIQ